MTRKVCLIYIDEVRFRCSLLTVFINVWEKKPAHLFGVS